MWKGKGLGHMVKSHKEIGAEIKRIRKFFGISQMRLAERVGVSFQQIQKYERGVNKISVEMIQRIAMALGVPVERFFEREKSFIVSESHEKYPSKKPLQSERPLSSEESTLLQLFRNVENKKIREGLIKQLKGIVELERRKG
jgi:transcriptional regulator with XRE-family HTH domain